LKASNLLERVQAEIDARRAELAPRLAEYQQLLSAAEALGLPTGEAQPRAGNQSTRVATTAKARAAKPAKAPVKARAAKPAKARAAKPAKAPAAKPAKARAAKPAAPASGRALRGAAQTAILAALEHGSHTVAELGVVTAMSGQNIRENLRRLLSSGTVTRAKREGKAAYVLAARSR
jgi:hypothetical protein